MNIVIFLEAPEAPYSRRPFLLWSCNQHNAKRSFGGLVVVGRDVSVALGGKLLHWGFDHV